MLQPNSPSPGTRRGAVRLQNFELDQRVIVTFKKLGGVPANNTRAM
jgi:hypothetical protein